MSDELKRKYLTLISWADWCAYADEINAELIAARARIIALEATYSWEPAPDEYQSDDYFYDVFHGDVYRLKIPPPPKLPEVPE